MDAASAVILVLVGLVALGYVQRVRGGRAMRLEWTRETALDDGRLEQLIRRHLRGYWPIGRVRGCIADGQLSRRIGRYAVSLNSEATVVVTITHPEGEHTPTCSVHAAMQDCEVETMAGMAHPAWSAPLAAGRRLRALLRALESAAAQRATGQQPAHATDPA
jgi:hypothetical protein